MRLYRFKCEMCDTITDANHEWIVIEATNGTGLWTYTKKGMTTHKIGKESRVYHFCCIKCLLQAITQSKGI